MVTKKWKKMTSSKIRKLQQKISDSLSPTAMDIYKYLWKGRDFELDHLWQRSVFLAAFVLAIAALYTGYMKEFFIPKYMISPIQTEHNIVLFGLIPIAITLLGLAFSVLWITMAKGSKAWYELYESNIAAISGNAKFWEGVDGKNTQLTKCFDKKKGGYKAYLFGNLENRTEPNGYPIDSKLFSADAGPFSVSKINTMIGIISLTAFLCAFGFHVHWTIKIFNEPEVQYGFFTLVCFTAELIAAFFIVFRLKNKVRSSYFDNL